MATTVGKLLVNRVLPEDLRRDDRVLDKKGLRSLLQEAAVKHPERFRELSHDLSQIGWRAAYLTGGNSFGLQHLKQTAGAKAARQRMQQQLKALLDDDSLTDEQRDQAIIKLLGQEQLSQNQQIYQESLAERNPLALQVLSGSRGNPMNLASLRGSDLLYTDHRDRVIPIPVLKSYSQGLSPVEYWAGSYGARKGVIDPKMATRDAGALGKQLAQMAHRLVITGLDAESPSEGLLGFPVDVEDEESEGSLLAHDIGGYKRNTVITPKLLQDLKRQGIKRFLVRSPAVAGAPDGGVYARDAGVREFGRLPELGTNVGLIASTSLAEPPAQGSLSSKHGGGVAGAAKAVSGFEHINSLVQVPKTFKGGAAHAEVDGLVTRIEDAPAGGKYVWIENQRHYVDRDFELKVKRGDHVEAGDVLSEGIPNPAKIVEHKGVGEGRRYFVDLFRQAYRDAGLTAHRRNIELLARGLINHVRLTDELGDFVPDDVVPYSMLEHRYQPREGYQLLDPRRVVGQYLEQPVLHYTVGTRVRPSMLRDFEEFGVKEVAAHPDPPPFQPEMIRGAANLSADPDWLTKMLGSNLKKGLLHSVHHGSTSDPSGTSYVPGLAIGKDFGLQGKVVTPQRKPPAAQDLGNPVGFH